MTCRHQLRRDVGRLSRTIAPTCSTRGRRRRCSIPSSSPAPSGSRFWDEAGNSWLDFSSQLVNVNIGHQHPKLVAAIKEQADKLCTVAPIHANDARSEAARLIAELAPADLNKVFFTNGGAEATENAMRMARGHTGRLKVLTTYRSYHGVDQRCDHDDGRPAALGQRARDAGRRQVLGPVPVPLRRSTPHDEPRSASARWRTSPTSIMVEGGQHDRGHRARDGRRHQRHPRAAGRLPARACATCATSTAS